MSSCQEKVESLLFRLGQYTLTGYIGAPRLKRIEQSGHKLNTELMCAVLYSEKGINVFKNKELRFDLLASLDQETQKNLIGENQSISEGLTSYNNFSWGKNHSSKNFLKLFNL